ncbi:MAG: serine/threonine protein kinase [Burkholderiales bacterium]|nr:serine/threonine protein kinase [Burkholderiales bacterium]
MSTPNASALKSVEPPALTRIGRFVITRELGRGSIGAVYLARDPIIDRDVAIKTFNPKLTAVEKRNHEEQLINEARAAGRLSHPHIVNILDAHSDKGVTYIVMEYLQGRELSRLLARQHDFEFAEIATIIGKVAEALDYAHKNGVVHRDIKPANIFMVGNSQPKILDFGIARAPNRVADQYANTGDAPYTLFHNNLLGTPTYMSPEQACGQPADERSDVYSLGAVMYEMLTGRRPFQEKETEKLLRMIALKMPAPPHELNPEVPEALSYIAMRAMSKQPEKRYQCGQDMANDLKRFLVKGKRARSKKGAVDDEQEDIEHHEPVPAKKNMFWVGILAAAAVLAAGAAFLFLR